MRVADFGRMDGQVLLFGGPYSNLAALEALGEVIDEGYAVCTGDIVAYCAEPNETTNLMRALNIPTIAGNCERQIATGALDCGCGFETGTECDLLSKGWYEFLSSACDTDTVAWLSDLPELATFEHHGKRYAVIHGGATDISKFIWPDSAEEVFLEEITALEAVLGKIDGVVSGHSGIAFQRRIEGYQWINAGVIGMPPHDGRPETRYVLLKDGEVVIKRLTYDHSCTRKTMVAAGLTQGYQETLVNGIWPSEEALPLSLRR